jgi:uncharacterized protein (TIGR00255 family)
MTGFARDEGRNGDYGWTWEAKSVNGRGLDTRCRLPTGFERLETTARAAVQKRFTRGSFTLALQLTRTADGGGYRVNRELLGQLIDLHGAFAGRVDPAPPRLETLLAVRGVVEAADVAESPDELMTLEAAVGESLSRALDSLAAMRREEGARLEDILGARLDLIDGLCDAAGTLEAVQPEMLRRRLEGQVAVLLDATPALPEDRLAQEAALLAVRADVREELDRLRAHTVAARELIAAGGAVGRRLDFLCQELNREANTLCSKSADVPLTRVGLDLKAAIDQLREQTQNLE